jgi:hypothetical protein
VSDRIEELAQLWRWIADDQFRGYSPLYERIARAVAGDRGLLEVVRAAPPSAHLPLVLLAAVHYLLLEGVEQGVEHPLAEVYAGRSSADPAPLFLDLCRTRRDDIVRLLATRHTQTNECGRSAVIGLGLTWLASELQVLGAAAPEWALIDVGASAGLNLLCDRYRLDYGTFGSTGPVDSPVTITCRVAGGTPPIASRLPPLAARIGIDRSPVDLGDPTDARWLLACVWPGTGRLERTAAAIRLACRDRPRVIAGDAGQALPDVLVGLPDGTAAIVLTTWAFAYLSIDAQVQFVEALAAESRRRTVAWLSAEGAGTVNLFTSDRTTNPDSLGSDVLGSVIFDRGDLCPQILGHTHPHGAWIDWRAPPL